MKRSGLYIFLCISVLIAPAIFAKESGEKGGTEDINIGLGELQESKSRPKRSIKKQVPRRPPTKPGSRIPGKRMLPSRPKKTQGNPDRPLVPGSIPNTKGSKTKPAKTMKLKGKKILQN